jgi:quercetin dioxygenase-like cupin family protein
MGDRIERLDALLARHPLAPGAALRADEIGRTATASVHLVQVRGGESPHRHDTHDLTVAVVRGAGVLTVERTRRRMESGDVAVVPRGAPHWFVNRGSTPAVAIVLYAPPLDAPDLVPVAGDVDSPPSAR